MVLMATDRDSELTSPHRPRCQVHRQCRGGMAPTPGADHLGMTARPSDERTQSPRPSRHTDAEDRTDEGSAIRLLARQMFLLAALTELINRRR